MKLLCDEMLKSLGEWLRVAGHDVLMLPDGTPDRVLVERAIEEARVMLTRDRKIAEIKSPPGQVVILNCSELDDCVEDLNRQLDVDWLYRPFTRCKLCNTLLEEADGEQEKQLPKGTKKTSTKIFYCPSCRQLFWDGSHVARMKKRLEKWNRLNAVNGSRQ